MSRTFVLEPTRLDLSQAREFGALEYVFEPGDKRCSIWAPDFTKEVIKALQRRDYDPSADYLVVVGHLANLVMTVGAMVARYGTVRVLLHSAVERRYVERTLGNETGRRGSVPFDTGISREDLREPTDSA